MNPDFRPLAAAVQPAFDAHDAQANPAAPLVAQAGYDDLARALHDVARRIDAGNPGADAALRNLLARLDGHADARALGLYVFAAGLARRLSGQAVAEANLYLGRFEVPQIHLFNLLGRAVPFVGLATRLCNESILQAMAGVQRPTLIDVGIGTGRQACLLLETMAATGRLPVRLTVIGIEPSDWALDEARRNIETTAERLGADVSFFGVVNSAEQLADADWRRIAQACTARPVVNASFALHHIADDADGHDRRDAVLAHLRALDPALLVLAEPDVDHRERGFYARFTNCLAHFGAVFRTLDRLPLAQADRDALKVGFFGREIADILGNPEELRSERHESSASWARRLQAAGFGLLVAAGQTDEQAVPGVVAVREREGRLSVDAQDEPVVAIFTAVPVPAGPPARPGQATSAPGATNATPTLLEPMLI